MKNKYHILFILYCSLIFISSSIPGYSLPDYQLHIGDKIIHFGIYFILFLFTYFSFKSYSNENFKSRADLYAFIFVVLFGISDEIHQYFIPLRTFDIYDIAADAAGGLAAFIIIYIITKRNLFKLKKAYD